MGKILTLVIGCWCLLIGCSTPGKPTEQQIADHQAEVERWFTERVDDLKSHDGYLNLAGLFWLNEGMNSFGSDSTNDAVFPAGKIAPRAGYFMVKGQNVTLIPTEGSGLNTGAVFRPDSTMEIKMLHGPAMTSGTLEWYIIRRGDKMGIRLRDLDSENLKNFRGIERYPVDYSWRIPAKFEPARNGETIAITNVLGQTSDEELTGTYVFEVEGKECRLAATGTGDKLFIVFADNTTGKETYGAGRFIYVPRPDSTGNVFIDFNQSYNPPCAFSDYATCPLPPKQNVLPVSILAGEKNYDLHGKQASHTF